eukprot:scaffold143915_cov18-Tisochrysis_lutea.AAC.1
MLWTLETKTDALQADDLAGFIFVKPNNNAATNEWNISTISTVLQTPLNTVTDIGTCVARTQIGPMPFVLLLGAHDVLVVWLPTLSSSKRSTFFHGPY